MMRADMIIGTSGVPHGFVCFGTNSWVTSIQTTLCTRWVVMVVIRAVELDFKKSNKKSDAQGAYRKSNLTFPTLSDF